MSNKAKASKRKVADVIAARGSMRAWELARASCSIGNREWEELMTLPDDCECGAMCIDIVEKTYALVDLFDPAVSNAAVFRASVRAMCVIYFG